MTSCVFMIAKAFSLLHTPLRKASLSRKASKIERPRAATAACSNVFYIVYIVPVSNAVCITNACLQCIAKPLFEIYTAL